MRCFLISFKSSINLSGQAKGTLTFPFVRECLEVEFEILGSGLGTGVSLFTQTISPDTKKDLKKYTNGFLQKGCQVLYVLKGLTILIVGVGSVLADLSGIISSHICENATTSTSQGREICKGTTNP